MDQTNEIRYFFFFSRNGISILFINHFCNKYHISLAKILTFLLIKRHYFLLYHIPSFPSPLFLTFFESLPRRVFFSDLWNPGGVWWYFKSKFWPLHTRTEMSDLSDKLTLKFHNLNCKKIFFLGKKRYTIFSPFWCPTKNSKNQFSTSQFS